MRRVLLLLTLVLLPTACYHATVTTGLRPSAMKIENKWANSFVYGLVPPPAVETMERCTSGVAQVDTQLSFLNQVVGFLTFGIYTPMEIVVTCASGGMEELPEARSREDAERLLRSGDTFLLRLD